MTDNCGNAADTSFAQIALGGGWFPSLAEANVQVQSSVGPTSARKKVAQNNGNNNHSTAAASAGGTAATAATAPVWGRGASVPVVVVPGPEGAVDGNRGTWQQEGQRCEESSTGRNLQKGTLL